MSDTRRMKGMTASAPHPLEKNKKIQLNLNFPERFKYVTVTQKAWNRHSEMFPAFELTEIFRCMLKLGTVLNYNEKQIAAPQWNQHSLCAVSAQRYPALHRVNLIEVPTYPQTTALIPPIKNKLKHCTLHSPCNESSILCIPCNRDRMGKMGSGTGLSTWKPNFLTRINTSVIPEMK